MKRRKQSRRWRGKKYAPVMIGMLVLLMNLAGPEKFKSDIGKYYLSGS